MESFTAVRRHDYSPRRISLGEKFSWRYWLSHGREWDRTNIRRIIWPIADFEHIKGSKYNRGIAAHKSLVEMLLRWKWKSFREWAEQKNDDSLNELIGDIDYQIKNFTSLFVDNNNVEENHQLCLQLEAISACLSRLNVQWIQFGQFGLRLSKTFQYWDEYVSMVLLLFDFIEAEREANWDIQLECLKQMLPFDHAKYFKWGLINVIDMLCLPQEAPEVYTAFKEGNHSVYRSKTV